MTKPLPHAISLSIFHGFTRLCNHRYARCNTHIKVYVLHIEAILNCMQQCTGHCQPDPPPPPAPFTMRLGSGGRACRACTAIQYIASMSFLPLDSPKSAKYSIRTAAVLLHAMTASTSFSSRSIVWLYCTTNRTRPLFCCYGDVYFCKPHMH